MYHELAAQPDQREWYLGLEFEQDQFLANRYRDLRNSEEWAPATLPGDQREFDFDCRASAGPGDERTVFRIRYFDYAGEAVGPGNEVPELSADLKRRANEAHALLVMFDGERVAELMSAPSEAPPPDTHDYFGNEMRPLLGLARDARCPVQLVITKWDLVCPAGATKEEEDELLRRTGRRLMRYGHIDRLVEAHCGRGEQVRLIPLSAVGFEFAEPRSDGPPAKRPDRILEPVNVDVPLCAVISDVLDRLERSLDPIRAKVDAEIERTTDVDLTSAVDSLLKIIAGAVRTALGAYIPPPVVRMLAELMVAAKRGAVQAPPAVENKDLAQPQRLRTEVIVEMNRIVKRFAHDYTSSLLGGSSR